VLIALALLGGLLGGAYEVVTRIGDKLSSSTAQDYSGSGSGSVLVDVQPGDPAAVMGRRLKAAGVVRTVQAFVDAAAADQRSQSIQPGTYRLHTKMSAKAALALLLDPSSKAVTRVVVPEGMRVSEIVALLATRTQVPAAKFTAALKSPKLGLPAFAKGKPEGMLFPATYDFQPGDSPLSMLQQMVAREKQELAKLRISGSVAYRDITIASMLEKEVNSTPDYGKAARVAYNRLAAQQPLGFDSSLHYYFGLSTPLTPERLAAKTPYNLRTNTGLPPTPISNPGEATLRAAMAPTPGPWMWFITIDMKSGKTLFFDNYNAFLAAKAKYHVNT